MKISDKPVFQLILEAQTALLTLTDKIKGPFPGTEEVVRLALRFTKKNPSVRDMLEMMLLYQTTIEDPSIADEAILSKSAELSLKNDPSFQQAAPDWWEDNASHRRKFRRLLEGLLDDPQKAISRRGKYLQYVQDDMLIVCRFDDDGEFKQQYFLFSIAAVYHFVMALLTEAKSYCWKRLGRCARDDCGAFFLRPIAAGTEGGRPRTYCTPECQLAVNRSEASERMKRRRERDRK